MTLLEAQAKLTELTGADRHSTIRADSTHHSTGSDKVKCCYYTEALGWSTDFPTIEALLDDARMAIQHSTGAQNDVTLDDPEVDALVAELEEQKAPR